MNKCHILSKCATCQLGYFGIFEKDRGCDSRFLRFLPLRTAAQSDTNLIAIATQSSARTKKVDSYEGSVSDRRKSTSSKINIFLETKKYQKSARSPERRRAHVKGAMSTRVDKGSAEAEPLSPALPSVNPIHLICEYPVRHDAPRRARTAPKNECRRGPKRGRALSSFCQFGAD